MSEKQAVIMGNIMEWTYVDNIYEVEIDNLRYKSLSDLRDKYQFDHTLKEPKIEQQKFFKEYVEITRTPNMSKDLKQGDSIYIPSDNKNYSIEQVATDIEGNTVYFINKVVDIVMSECAEESKLEAQKRIDEWLEEKKKEKQQKKHEAMVKNKTGKMDKAWKLFR